MEIIDSREGMLRMAGIRAGLFVEGNPSCAGVPTLEPLPLLPSCNYASCNNQATSLSSALAAATALLELQAHMPRLA